MNIAAKNFYILAIKRLSVLHNYFNSSTKLLIFSDLYPAKILDLSAKPFRCLVFVLETRSEERFFHPFFSLFSSLTQHRSIPFPWKNGFSLIIFWNSWNRHCRQSSTEQRYMSCDAYARSFMCFRRLEKGLTRTFTDERNCFATVFGIDKNHAIARSQA